MKIDLLDVFNARAGAICFVGAGGKKTTMYRLAAEHPGRVAITATSHIEYFPRRLAARKIIGPEDGLLEQIRADSASRVIAFAQPSQRRGRHAGISLERVVEFQRAGGFELMLIKADGARSRLIKAPAEHEPPIPACTSTIVPIVSAKVFGKKLTERVAHRIDQLSAITGLQPGEKIEPGHVARLLASPEGSLKNAGHAMVIPLINMVDDDERAIHARAAAEQALALTRRFGCVVLAAMRNAEPVIEIVRR